MERKNVDAEKYMTELRLFEVFLSLSFELIYVCVAARRQVTLPKSYITIAGWHKRGCTKDLEGLDTLLCV